MAQKVTGIIKLQINAAKATASPPVGPALGQHGVNIAAFIKEFNARTKDMEGYKIPVVITVYADRSFTFITKTPPTPMLIMKAIGLEKGSGVPNKTKVGTITKAQIAEIAKTKMPDLNCPTLEPKARLPVPAAPWALPSSIDICLSGQSDPEMWEDFSASPL